MCLNTGHLKVPVDWHLRLLQTNHSIQNALGYAENIQHFFDVAVSEIYDRRNCLDDSQKVIREVKLKPQKKTMYETDREYSLFVYCHDITKLPRSRRYDVAIQTRLWWCCCLKQRHIKVVNKIIIKLKRTCTTTSCHS